VAETDPSTPTWRSVATVGGVAALTLVAADLFLQTLAPTLHPREVEEAIADYRASDPTTLVLGSSHARSFVAVDRVLRERGSQERVVAVPLEWGKFTSYEWVLKNRLLPVIDEKDSAGNLVRGRLKRFIMLTAWWDICGRDGAPKEWNVPSRAWAFPDFLRSVWDEGLNNYSRTYVSTRWTRGLDFSILVTDRGHDRLAAAVVDAVRGKRADVTERRAEAQRKKSIRIVEDGVDCVAYPAELAAMNRILDWAKERGLDTSVVLFPMAPSVMTPLAREKVMVPSELALHTVAQQRGLRYVDYTYAIGLTEADFRVDLDHLNPTGDAKFADYVLSRELAFLKGDAAPAASAPPLGVGAPDAPAAR
jgi:hypothetical protein